MNRGFFLVMAAQALSSLADNALFIAAIALIQQLQGPDWMAPMMKWWFAAAYVLLAAFVGGNQEAGNVSSASHVVHRAVAVEHLIRPQNVVLVRGDASEKRDSVGAPACCRV